MSAKTRIEELDALLAKWADPKNPAPREHNGISTAFLRGLNGHPRTNGARTSDAFRAFRAGQKRREAIAKAKSKA